jgi:peptidoglycan/LPS O-acetylase OafA/YrhL
LTIGVTLIVFKSARASAPWHVLQISNFYFTRVHQWAPWPFAHFWSLNVEEQYYLLWPLAVFFLPRKFLGPFLVLTAIGGFIWRVAISGRSDFFALLPDNVFPLAVGGILAIYGQNEGLRKALNVIGPIGLIAVVLLLIPAVNDRVPPTMEFLVLLLTTASFAYLVNGARRRSLGFAGTALKSKPLVSVGRITYGSYVFHLLVLWFFLRIGVVHDYGWFRFFVCTPFVLLLAWMSWVYIERPINRLKAYYPVS